MDDRDRDEPVEKVDPEEAGEHLDEPACDDSQAQPAAPGGEGTDRPLDEPEGEPDEAETAKDEVGEASDGEVDPTQPSETFDEIIETVSREGLAPRPADLQEEESIREHLERAVRVPLEVYVRVVKGERVARALTKDISVSGLFLAALTLPVAEAGEAVMVELSLPGADEPIWARARVARGQDRKGFPSLGLSFEELTDADRKAIEDYISVRSEYVEE